MPNFVGAFRIRLRTYVTILVFVTGAILLIIANKALIDLDKEKWERRREIVNKQAIEEFSHSVENFAHIASSLRALIECSDKFPATEEMQKFLNLHLKDLNYQDSIIVSIADTSHTFTHSFNRKKINPSGLVGINILDITNPAAVRNLTKVMLDHELHLFPPHNIIEGWAAISINFALYRDNQVMGYVTPQLNFKTVVNEIYDSGLSEEFVFHFQTQDGVNFDRERVYGNSRVHHNRKDPEYYKNYDIANSEFIYNDFSLYGQGFRIGTAYKVPFRPDMLTPIFWILWYVVVFVLAIVIVRINRRLRVANKKVEIQKRDLEFKNKQLVEAGQVKDKFFSIIGHDLKSPLNTINTLIGMKRNNIISQDETERFLEDLDKLTHNTVGLLNNLLEWANVNSGKQELNVQRIYISRMLDDIIQLNQGTARLKEIIIENHSQQNLELDGDQNMVATILRNLLSNALKFTFKGGKVEIRCENVSDSIKISITDNGQGMNEKTLSELFLTGKGKGSAGTSGEMGTGLGLVLCKEYVEMHRGKIWAESTEGEGSTFNVILPVHQTEQLVST
ncbi:MAG: HAMP domain-containing sensor histidine kinase [Cyclobacteriaceae bacterium]